MSRPYTQRSLVLTPKTAHVKLDVDLDTYPRGAHFRGNIGDSEVSFKLTEKELRHLSGFFRTQVQRLARKR